MNQEVSALLAQGPAPRHLTRKERSLFNRLEREIAKALNSYVTAGTRLAVIREQGLYLEGWPTFEEYCRERWGLSRIHAYRLIETAKLASHFPAHEVPRTERQARELLPLRDRPDEALEVLRDARTLIVGGEPTAALLRRRVARALGKPDGGAWEGDAKIPSGSPNPRRDHTGAPGGWRDIVCYYLTENVEEGIAMLRTAGLPEGEGERQELRADLGDVIGQLIELQSELEGWGHE